MKGQYIQFFKKSDKVKNFHLLVEDKGNTQIENKPLIAAFLL